ncbi:exit protein of rhodopsin and TRP A [Temnothorax americanus]|uniref:exit protein of rhodopsin and TRP A n=1 Tax=Temnothorax americanus TaxID=1964332 RepID=UPI0040678170
MISMKKRGNNENKGSKTGGCQNGGKATENSDSGNLSDDENQGFGNWLRSSTGAEMMRLFVIANSILVFVTMAWPNMKESFYIIKDYFMGEED